jgi:hypothetical protein
MHRPSSLPYALFDAETLAILQRTNLDSMLETNRRLLEAAQAIVDLRLKWLAASFEAAAAFAPNAGNGAAEPPLAAFRRAGDHALAMVRGEIEVSLKAQSEVAQTLVELASANLRELERMDRS